MEKINKKKYYWLLILACFFVYIATICIKKVYSSELVAIIEAFGETKARASLGTTAYYTTYFITQIVLAPFMKKINVGKFMVITICLSSVLYGIIPYTTNLYHIWIIQALNGILHSSVWGGCMYFFGKYLPKDMNGIASSIMSVGFVGGTVVSYVIAPFFIKNGIWKYAFLLFAVILFASVITFIFVERTVEKALGDVNTKERAEIKMNNSPKEEKSVGLHYAYIAIIITAIISLVSNIAYYAFTDWFPIYLIEIFKMETTYSVAVTVVLYVFSFIFINGGIMLCERGKNGMSKVLFAFGVIAAIVAIIQTVTYKSNIILAIALSTLIVAFIRAIVAILSTYMPLKINDKINAATTSMIVNATASLAAAIGPTFLGGVIDVSGWTSFFIIMAVICSISFVLILASSFYFKKLNI